MWDINPLSFLFGSQAILLLFICGFLLLHILKRKRYIKQLEDKITDIRILNGTARRKQREAEKKLAELEGQPTQTYPDYIDEHLEATRTYHEALNPDRDIVLDIEPEAPIERRVASLRYALLMAEKEANENAEKSDWTILQSKLEKIIEFYGLKADEQEQNKASTSEPVSSAIGEHQELINRLRRMAADQQETISQLMAQLENEDDLDTGVYDSLKKQLEQQKQFIKESETCIELLETELSRLIDENEVLKTAGGEEEENVNFSDEDRAHLESLVGELTDKGKQMLCAIAGLESENRELQSKLGN